MLIKTKPQNSLVALIRTRWILLSCNLYFTDCIHTNLRLIWYPTWHCVSKSPISARNSNKYISCQVTSHNKIYIRAFFIGSESSLILLPDNWIYEKCNFFTWANLREWLCSSSSCCGGMHQWLLGQKSFPRICSWGKAILHYNH